MLPIQNRFVESLRELSLEEEFFLKELAPRISSFAMAILSVLGSVYFFVDAAKKTLTLAAHRVLDSLPREKSDFLSKVQRALPKQESLESIWQVFLSSSAKHVPGAVFGAIGTICPVTAQKLAVELSFYKSKKIERKMYVRLLRRLFAIAAKEEQQAPLRIESGNPRNFSSDLFGPADFSDDEVRLEWM